MERRKKTIEQMYPKAQRNMGSPKAPQKSRGMPSQETIDKNSTKGRMGEGKVDTVGAIVKGAVKAATKMGESMKRIVDISTNRTTKVNQDNKDRVNKLKEKK